MGRIPGAVGIRKDGRDASLAQREADALHTNQLPVIGKRVFNTGEDLVGVTWQAVNEVLVDGTLGFLMCNGPTTVSNFKQIQFYAAVVTGASVLEIALYALDRNEKTLRMLPGSYAKTSITAVGKMTLPIDCSFQPPNDLIYVGYRRTGGTALSISGSAIGIFPSPYRSTTSPGTWPSKVLLGNTPVSSVGVVAYFAFLPQEVIDLI